MFGVWLASGAPANKCVTFANSSVQLQFLSFSSLRCNEMPQRAMSFASSFEHEHSPGLRITRVAILLISSLGIGIQEKLEPANGFWISLLLHRSIERNCETTKTDRRTDTHTHTHTVTHCKTNCEQTTIWDRYSSD